MRLVVAICLVLGLQACSSTGADSACDRLDAEQADLQHDLTELQEKADSEGGLSLYEREALEGVRLGLSDLAQRLEASECS